MGTDDLGSSKAGTGWVVAGLIILAAAVFYLWFQSQGQDAEAEADATPPSTEWTTKPEGGVEVNLPQTPMTNTPANETPVEGPPTQTE